jgi:hypothetical protein
MIKFPYSAETIGKAETEIDGGKIDEYRKTI